MFFPSRGICASQYINLCPREEHLIITDILGLPERSNQDMVLGFGYRRGYRHDLHGRVTFLEMMSGNHLQQDI